ncbi:MAG: nucleoside hydrolase [Clostridia bacterium]|nr:nucleoside hydrolase [Clostridia bacterium]
MLSEQQRLKNLSVPVGKIDVVLDTDACNEIDDQFAISYLLKSTEKCSVKALYAAPYFNKRSESPENGMEKSYHEIFRLLELLGEKYPVFRGSAHYLSDEKTPVISDAARDLAERAKHYTPENPLYVVAIGAITNVASAILLEPKVAENTVLVWLGGHAMHYHDTAEFNMKQDVAGARVVFGCGIPLVQLPCLGVVSEFRISKPELQYWLVGKNPLASYLANTTIEHADAYAEGKPWTRVIWDVTAVAWLLNEDERFMRSRIIQAPIPTYDNLYAENPQGYPMRYVYFIKRDALMQDLFEKICG